MSRVTRPFFDRNLPTSPCVTLDFFRILPRHAVFCSLSVYFGPASRSILTLLGPRHARFFSNLPPPLVTRDAIYERALAHIDELVAQIEGSLDALERERLLRVVDAVTEARRVPLRVAVDVELEREALAI